MEDMHEAGLEIAIQSNETYRARARSVAALLAAASGALAVALVIAPSISLPDASRVLGFISVSLLIIATCAFVVASITGSQTKLRSSRSYIDFLPWIVPIVESTNSRSTSEKREKQARALGSRIRLISDIGLIGTGVALIVLLVALGLATFLPAPKTVVEIAVKPRTLSTVCQGLSSPFTGVVSVDQLNSPSESLRVELPSASCGESQDAGALYVPRSAIIAIREPHL